MAKNQYLLICDESGAKGFSDKAGTPGNEIGVVAGVLLPSNEASEFNTFIEELHKKYLPGDGKLHITSLDHDIQQQIRADIEGFISGKKLHIVYEAFSQTGFHAWYQTEKKFFDAIRAARKEAGYDYNVTAAKKRMLVQLYLGMFSRALGYISDFEVKPVSCLIKLIIDETDDPIQHEILEAINKYIHLTPVVEEVVSVSRFNVEENVVEKAEGTITMAVTDGYLEDFSGVSCEISLNSASALIADIVSNSVCYYIRKSFEANPQIRLSCIEAIVDYPLRHHCVALSDKDGFDPLQNLFSFPFDSSKVEDDPESVLLEMAKRVSFTKKE